MLLYRLPFTVHAVTPMENMDQEMTATLHVVGIPHRYVVEICRTLS